MMDMLRSRKESPLDITTNSQYHQTFCGYWPQIIRERYHRPTTFVIIGSSLQALHKAHLQGLM
jgi:hypothetical protein